MDLGRPGRAAAAATYAGGDLRGRGASAGLLRTAVGGLRRALYPLTWVQRQRHAAIFFGRPEAMELEDGPRAAGASGRGGDLRRRRPTGSRRERRAVAHSGWGAQACSLSVDLGAAAAARGDFLWAAGGDGARGWTSGGRGERPRRRPTPAATYGVAARAPGCCAQRLGGSGVLSIR